MELGTILILIVVGMGFIFTFSLIKISNRNIKEFIENKLPSNNKD